MSFRLIGMFLKIRKCELFSGGTVTGHKLVSTIDYGKIFYGNYPNTVKMNNYPIKNYRGERWAYSYFIGGSANHPIIYLRFTLGLRHEACKCVYLRILISDVPTNKKYEEKIHIE